MTQEEYDLLFGMSKALNEMQKDIKGLYAG